MSVLYYEFQNESNFSSILEKKSKEIETPYSEMKGLTAVIDIKTEADKVDWNSLWNLWWVKNPPTVMAKILLLLR